MIDHEQAGRDVPRILSLWWLTMLAAVFIAGMYVKTGGA